MSLTVAINRLILGDDLFDLRDRPRTHRCRRRRRHLPPRGVVVARRRGCWRGCSGCGGSSILIGRRR